VGGGWVVGWLPLVCFKAVHHKFASRANHCSIGQRRPEIQRYPTIR
jgi:hypothetical protein